MDTNDHETVSVSHQRSSQGLSAGEPLGHSSFHGCFCAHDFHMGDGPLLGPGNMQNMTQEPQGPCGGL